MEVAMGMGGDSTEIERSELDMMEELLARLREKKSEGSKQKLKTASVQSSLTSAMSESALSSMAQSQSANDQGLASTVAQLVRQVSSMQQQITGLQTQVNCELFFVINMHNYILYQK
jgi:hypothetical protein